MATAGQYYRGYATYVLLSWASLLHQYCFFFYLHKIHIFSIDIILLCFWFCFTPETGWEWGLQEKLGSVQGRIWTSVSRWYHWVLAGQWKNSFNNYAVHSAICLTNRTGGLERQKRVFAHDASENDSLKPTAPTAASVCTALWKKDEPLDLLTCIAHCFGSSTHSCYSSHHPWLVARHTCVPEGHVLAALVYLAEGICFFSSSFFTSSASYGLDDHCRSLSTELFYSIYSILFCSVLCIPFSRRAYYLCIYRHICSFLPPRISSLPK